MPDIPEPRGGHGKIAEKCVLFKKCPVVSDLVCFDLLSNFFKMSKYFPPICWKKKVDREHSSQIQFILVVDEETGIIAGNVAATSVRVAAADISSANVGIAAAIRRAIVIACIAAWHVRISVKVADVFIQ